MNRTGHVTVVDAGGPIQIVGAHIEQAGGAEQLRLVYRNRGDGLVQRFEITSLMPAAGARSNACRTIVGALIVPGKYATATVRLPDAATSHDTLTLAVTRARFDDLAVWTPEPHRTAQRYAKGA
jgi:hypothetical protein